MEANTTSLRKSAPEWSLAGDKQLLDILQNIHQSLVTRCTEVNNKLDEMVLALDGASVDLQNVNNKFMALSNSQFIESRVYDDDVDIAAQEIPKETPKPQSQTSDLEKMKQTIRVLERNHELIEILDSDTDDSDDDVSRIVLKPKDMYSHRPLPYIIGTQAWKNKWHAGLHPEDSDSDSSVSKQEVAEQYSDSEPEPEETPNDTLHENSWGYGKTKESTGSSEVLSEQDATVGSLPTAGMKPSPSDIAAELARRLGGNMDQIPIPAPELPQPNMAAKKVYRPDQPTVGTVFSDEPPPLDQYQSEEELPEEDNDIFAELHKNKPYAYDKREQSRLAEDLFSGLDSEDTGDIFSDFKDNKTSSTPVAKKTILFHEEPEPEMFVEKPKNIPEPKQDTVRETEGFKKPVGGISLFGNNKGAESIGAAILKRNQRKSSSDEDTAEETSRLPVKKEPTPVTNKEKDMFDDLFAKSEREQKKAAQKKQKDIPKTDNSKIDLFSDNIFDDIDDIFTTNVTVSKKEHKNEKPLFEDDDDIFSDIAVAKESKVEPISVRNNKKSIFDSDDELFAEKSEEKPQTSTSRKENIAKSENLGKNTRVEDIFGNDTEDDIFSDLVGSKSAVSTKNIVNVATEDITKAKNENSDIETQNNNNKVTSKANLLPQNEEKATKAKENKLAKSIAQSKSIFGSDGDDDELFATSKTTVAPKHNTFDTSAQSNLKGEKKLSKPPKISLFDDDSDENDLFGATTKNIAKNTETIKSDEKLSSTSNESVVSKGKTTVFEDLEPNDVFKNTDKQPDTENNNQIISESSTLLSTGNTSDTIDNKKEMATKSNNNSIFGEDGENEVSSLFSKVVIKPAKQQKPVLSEKPAKLPIEPTENTETTEKPNQVADYARLENKQAEPSNNYNNNTNQNDSATMEDPKQYILDEKEILTPNSDDVSAKTDLQTHEIKSNKPVTGFPSDSKVEPDTMMNEEKDILFSSPPELILHTPNVFDDIFSEPPAFEKSSEPKKSKNVNALFDDDSDDEALFFKKNDPIPDENLDLSTDSNNEALFGIFHDEPPAIVDFSQKPEQSNINADFLDDSDDELFTSRSDSYHKNKHESSENTQKHTNLKTAEDILPQVQTKEQSVKKSEKTVSNQAEIIEQELKDHKSEAKTHKDVPDGSETKKVGKLKTMNFNINVNTLLPGASPKKKAVEQTDGQTLSAKSHEDLHTKEKTEPIVAKSISFDGESSQVLDNKISKERAKIQVKRRPSTRRARKEAVRKSGIDYGEDSTDNSSSIDDIPKSNAKETRPVEVNPDFENDSENKIDSSLDQENTAHESNFDFNKDEIDSSKDDMFRTQSPSNIEETVPTATEPENTEIGNEQSISKNNTTFEEDFLSDNNVKTRIDNVQTENNSDNKVEAKKAESKTVTSKVVYILNDEDIFANPNILNMLADDDDDLFKNLGNTFTSTSSINTLGNTYKDITSNTNNEVKVHIDSKNESGVSAVHIEKTTKLIDDTAETNQSKLDNNRNSKPTKTSLLDDLSDEENELFNKNKKVKVTEVKNTTKKASSKVKSILDSDSDEDLFGGRKKERETQPSGSETKDTVQAVKVKTSLFGEDEDDNLFAVKAKNSGRSPQPARSTREVLSKPSEPVFDDPLSLLGGEDD